jgi:hypothetical protein
MDLNRLTRDADDLIRKVVSRYNQLYVPAGTISQLELDLMLDDLRKLYDTFKNIGHINLTLQNTANKPEVKVNSTVHDIQRDYISADSSFTGKEFNSYEAPPPPQTDIKTVVETIPEYKPEPVHKSEPEPAVAEQVETKEELITESQTETEAVFENEVPTAPESLYSVTPAEETKDSTAPVSPEPAPAMLADKFNTGSKSLSETMASSQSQAGMGSRLQFQPISDLITGIGLNDKFSFISDLFGNSAMQYDEAIHRINKAVNLDEANWILQKYHTSEWEHKHETLARLKDFVKRRFI